MTTVTTTTTNTIDIPNPDRLDGAQAHARGLARFDALHREDPLLAVVVIGDMASVLIMGSGGAGEGLNPFALILSVGCIGEAQWPQGLVALRETVGAWREQEVTHG